MATFSVTTTPEQDDALVVLRAKLNATRATPLTAAQFRDYLVTQWLDSLTGQVKQDTQITLREKWEASDDTTKAEIKILLGM